MTGGLHHYVKEMNDYTQLKVLGKGAAGTVWLCRDSASNRDVAMKVLREFAASDSKSFLREIQIPLRLNLPGIVPLVGFGLPSTESGPDRGAMIITEYMPNGTLQDVIDQRQSDPGALTPTGISKAIFGIAATMAAMHDHNAIHRDLKPGNIFLDADMEIRIADFGLSRFAINGVHMTNAIGTPLFMAPELYVDSDEAYGPSVDVYAFGMVVFYLFSSNMSLDDGIVTRSPQQLLLRIMRGARPKRPRAINDGLWQLAQTCWSQDPADRPTFRQIVAQLHANDELTVKGTDLAEYHAYQKRIARGRPVKPDSAFEGVEQRRKMALRPEGAKREKLPVVKRYDFTRSSKRRTGDGAI
jgi:serine/threonine protein kinase